MKIDQLNQSINFLWNTLHVHKEDEEGVTISSIVTTTVTISSSSDYAIRYPFANLVNIHAVFINSIFTALMSSDSVSKIEDGNDATTNNNTWNLESCELHRTTTSTSLTIKDYSVSLYIIHNNNSYVLCCIICKGLNVL